MKTFILIADKREIFYKEFSNLTITGIGTINASKSIINIINSLSTSERLNSIILNVGTCASFKHKEDTILKCGKFIDANPSIKLNDIDFTNLNKNFNSICATSPIFIEKSNQHLFEKINVDCFDMESYVLAMFCKMYNVNFLSIKYVTDSGDLDFSGWESKLEKAAPILTNYLKKFLNL